LVEVPGTSDSAAEAELAITPAEDEDAAEDERGSEEDKGCLQGPDI